MYLLGHFDQALSLGLIWCRPQMSANVHTLIVRINRNKKKKKINCMKRNIVMMNTFIKHFMKGYLSSSERVCGPRQTEKAVNHMLNIQSI